MGFVPQLEVADAGIASAERHDVVMPGGHVARRVELRVTHPADFSQALRRGGVPGRRAERVHDDAVEAVAGLGGGGERVVHLLPVVLAASGTFDLFPVEAVVADERMHAEKADQLEGRPARILAARQGIEVESEHGRGSGHVAFGCDADGERLLAARKRGEAVAEDGVRGGEMVAAVERFDGRRGVAGGVEPGERSRVKARTRRTPSPFGGRGIGLVDDLSGRIAHKGAQARLAGREPAAEHDILAKRKPVGRAHAARSECPFEVNRVQIETRRFGGGCGARSTGKGQPYARGIGGIGRGLDREGVKVRFTPLALGRNLQRRPHELVFDEPAVCGEELQRRIDLHGAMAHIREADLQRWARGWNRLAVGLPGGRATTRRFGGERERKRIGQDRRGGQKSVRDEAFHKTSGT